MMLLAQALRETVMLLTALSEDADDGTTVSETPTLIRFECDERIHGPVERRWVPSPQVPRSDRVPTRPLQAVDPLESRPRLTNERLASSELQDRTRPPSKPELGAASSSADASRSWSLAPCPQS